MARGAPGREGGGLEIVISEAPRTVLFAERLRDGRVALGTRAEQRDGSWEPGELHLLEPGALLALAAWLAPLVEEAWIGTVRERQDAPLRTAGELYGGGAAAVERLVTEMLPEIPPGLLARAMILLANSIGPDSRARLIERLNRTTSGAEEDALRRQLADEHESFAYAVALAALFDALERGVDEAEDAPGP